MATWGELKTMVAADLGRGSSKTTAIANSLRQAGLWLERNYSFQYMNRYVTFTLDADATEPRAIPIPSRPKKFDFVRLVLANNVLHYIPRVLPTDVAARLTALPRGYWLDSNEGTGYIWFDNTPDQDYSGEMNYQQFTEWWNLDDGDEPWPLLYAEDFLKYQALLQLGPNVRMNNQTWEKIRMLRDAALQTLLTSEYEITHGGVHLDQMEFVPTNYLTNQYPTATG